MTAEDSPDYIVYFVTPTLPTCASCLFSQQIGFISHDRTCQCVCVVCAIMLPSLLTCDSQSQHQREHTLSAAQYAASWFGNIFQVYVCELSCICGFPLSRRCYAEFPFGFTPFRIKAEWHFDFRTKDMPHMSTVQWDAHFAQAVLLFSIQTDSCCEFIFPPYNANAWCDPQPRIHK